jgi:hypothetical protein
MAKPFPGVSGNGLHLHHSLRKDGRNVFEHATDADALGNASMRHWVAGLTTHAAQIALLANPTVNAYKRIEDYSFAPTRVSWGLDNRNVAVRCIPQVGAGSRVEYRGGAADANPYLLTAGVLAAGLDGSSASWSCPDAGARRLRRQGLVRSCHARWAPRSTPGRPRRSRARRSVSDSRTITRRWRATTWRCMTRSSPTGKRSATGSSHSLGATRKIEGMTTTVHDRRDTCPREALAA